MIKVINFNYKHPEDAIVINTTSRSYNWSRGLSPFVVGPIDLYSGYVSKNLENAWQYSKIFQKFLEDDGSVGEKYFNWAKKGWDKLSADRYPMGRGAKPLFSYWDGERLGYVEARKRIYIPLYAAAVRKTEAFKKLQMLYLTMEPDQILYLRDFDSHNLEPWQCDYWKLWENPNIRVDHGYCLAMMLENLI